MQDQWGSMPPLLLCVLCASSSSLVRQIQSPMEPLMGRSARPVRHLVKANSAGCLHSVCVRGRAAAYINQLPNRSAFLSLGEICPHVHPMLSPTTYVSS